MKNRLSWKGIAIILMLLLFGCDKSPGGEEDLYRFMVQKIAEYRSEPLEVSGQMPEMVNGWEANEDESGVTIVVKDGSRFADIDEFFRDVLGDPSEVWEGGKWVVYNVHTVGGATVSYQQLPPHEEEVKVVILRAIGSY